ncbi:MAG: 3'-5' exonuclease [Salegentibacter sp.]
MIFDLFRKKQGELPEYWQEYEQKFKAEPPAFAEESTFVVLDTETTGFHPRKDRMLCIGAVKISSNTIEVNSAFEVYLEQEEFNPETVEIHGILKNEKTPRISEEKAIREFLNYIGNSILVAHHASFDIRMINEALRRLQLPKLKNTVLDTGVLYRRTRINSNLVNRDRGYTLDEIAEAYSIDTRDRHTAAGDAFITAIAFLKILGRLKKDSRLKLKDLF